MNMNNEAKTVYMTIYFDYIEGHPAHFNEIKPVWLDAAQCGTSEIGGRSAGAKFDFSSPAWSANFEGEIQGAGGHLHDGGTKLDILVNNKVICSSVPTYGTDAQARARAEIAKTGNMAAAKPDAAGGKGGAGGKGMAGMPGMAGHSDSQHIIAMSICGDNTAGIKDIPISPLGLKELKKGQSWTIRAYYDYNAHGGMKNHNTGKMSNVMGISIFYTKTTVKRKAG
jgi:hypothetical protein